VQVGVYHRVDVARGQPFGLQRFQETAAAEVGHVGDAEVDGAESEVDQDRAVGGADQEGADADGEPATLIKNAAWVAQPSGWLAGKNVAGLSQP